MLPKFKWEPPGIGKSQFFGDDALQGEYMHSQKETALLKRSQATGKMNIMTLPLPLEDFRDAYNKWKGGVLIQRAFPTLTAEQREFIMTGTTPEEWDEMFPEDDE